MKRFGRRKRYRRRLGVLMLMLAGVVGVALSAGLAIAVTSSQGECSVGAAGSIECDLGDIKSGESATIQISTVASAPGFLVDSVTVSGDQHDRNPTNNTAMEETVVVGRVDQELVDVAVTKVDSPDPVAIDGTLTYTIEVINHGPALATGVNVSDKLPSHGVQFVSATASQGTCSPGFASVNCDIGALAPGGRAIVAIVVTPTSVGSVRNSVCANAREFDPDLNNNCDDELTNIVRPVTDLAVVKADDQDPVNVGDSVTYTITVTNNGPDDASGVVVKDKLIAIEGNQN